MRRARGLGESHIHPDASQGPKQHHRTEICHRLWAPSTPTIDIHKHILPHCLSSFFSTPEKYNCLISGSNKSTINNANKIKISVRHKESITNLTVLRVSQQGLMGSAVHGTYRRGQMCATSTGNKMFPRVTTAALFPFM